jgi:hypothetical protein
MAGRPEKHTVDFYPHYTNASGKRTLTILFNHFQHEGISAWWQLLEVMGSTENHAIDIRALEDFEYLAGRLRFTPERARAILDKMAAVDALDRELYQAGWVWSQNFVEHLKSVYQNRDQCLPNKPVISTGDNDTGAVISTGDNTQREEGTKGSRESKGNTPLAPQGGTADTGHNKKTELPDWLKKEDWAAFKEMRLKLRAPLTDKATSLLLAKLDKLRACGDDAGEILNQSIMNGWKSVFPLHGGGNGRHDFGRQGTPRALATVYTKPEDL